MADYNSSLPVRSQDNNTSTDDGALLVTQINGGTTLANKAEVNGDSELLVHDKNLTSGEQISQIADADNDVLAVNSDGSINVNVVDTAVGDQLHIYDTKPTIAPNTPTTVVTHTVTVDKTFLIKEIFATAAGKIKAELKVDGAVVATAFNSTSDPNVAIVFPSPIEVAAGKIILISVTNRDNSSTDLYAFINGVEI